MVSLVLIGLAAGVLSVLLGVGGGIIIVPALVYFTKMNMQMATGTSLAVIIPTAIVGVLGKMKAGQVDLRLAALVIVGAVAGAYLGGLFAAKAPDKLLKQLFSLLLIFTAVRMFLSTR